MNAIKDTPSIYKSLFIRNLPRLINWLEDFRKGNFIIGVYDKEDTIYDQLTSQSLGKSFGI